MAAIISRITRENRARKEQMGKEVSIAKCTYHLEPFPVRFEASKHNKYLKNRNLYLTVDKMNAGIQDLFRKRIQEMEGERTKVTTQGDAGWWRTFCCECLVMRDLFKTS